jgi:hypothetical protein
LPWIGGERGRKKKCPPHSTLKRIKVIKKKGDKQGEKEKNQKIIFL